MGDRQILNTRKSHRAILFVSGFLILGAIVTWAIWPGPILRFRCLLYYDELTVSGVVKKDYFSDRLPFATEIVIECRDVAPSRYGISIIGESWQLVVGRDSLGSLEERNWSVDRMDPPGAFASKEGDWGRIDTNWNNDELQRIRLYVFDSDIPIQVRVPSLNKDEGIAMPCEFEKVMAIFGKPKRMESHILH